MKRLTQFIAEAGFDPNEPRDHGKWTRVAGTDDDSLLGHWEWPHASPSSNVSYLDLRNPKTKIGKKMTAVLDKMPMYKGTLYRGLVVKDKDLGKLIDHKGYTLKLHSSSSRDEKIARQFMSMASEAYNGTKVMLKINNGLGADINGYLDPELQGTKEVVLRAGSHFKFKGLTRKDNYIEIELEQE